MKLELTQNQIDAGGLEKSQRKVNGKIPYEYAWMVFTAREGKGVLAEEFFEGHNNKVDIINMKLEKIIWLYESNLQYKFNIQDFPSVDYKTTGVKSPINTYEAWVTYLKRYFPELT